MRVARLTTAKELAAVASPWDHLGPGRPVLTRYWLETWWRHFGSGAGPGRRELFALCVHTDDGQLAGLAPWYVEASWRGRRVVRFLGSGAVCSDGLSILCRPGMERQVATAVADWLFDGGASCRAPSRLGDESWDLLDLTSIDDQDVTMRMLVDACAGHGGLTHRHPAADCWRVQLPKTWDDYLAILSKSHRKRIRRLENIYFRPGRARMHWVTGSDDFAQGFQVLVDLHQRYWQSRGEPGRFGSGPFAAFHHEAARRLLGAGRLRLGWLELDGQPAAAEYHLVGDGVVYAYQSGRDPVASEHQPGNLSMMASIKAAIEEGYTTLDFMRGDEPYKAHWRAEPHRLQNVRVLPNRVSSRFRHCAWYAGVRARSCLRAGRRALARNAAMNT